MPTIAARALGKLLTYAERVGIDREAVLAELGIEPRIVCDLDARVPLPDVHAAWERVIALARTGADVQFAGELYTPGEYGLLGFVVLTSATIDEALGQLVRYISLWTDEPSFTRAGSTVRAVYRRRWPDREGLRLATESAFIELIQAARHLTRSNVVPRAVRFAHRAPSDPTGHSRFFGCEVQFDAPAHELELRDEDLALALPLPDPQLAAFLRQAASEALGVRTVESSSTIERARAIITADLARSVPSIDAVARKLAIGTRTLRRRLAESGSSFRQLLEETRSELARSYVRDRRVPLAEVAFLLGFSDPSTFHRAFKRWTGTTPAEWRNRTR